MEKNKIVFSVAVAELGGIGGKTQLPEEFLEHFDKFLRQASSLPGNLRVFEDYLITSVRNSLVVILSHRHGLNYLHIKSLYDKCFTSVQEEIKRHNLFSLKEIKPVFTELEIGLNFQDPDRPSEQFALLIGRECPVKIFNYALYETFCNPASNKELVMNSEIRKGFTMKIINTLWENKSVYLKIPEESWDMFNMIEYIENSFIKEIHSVHNPEEQIVETSLTKDGFVSIVRTERSFPSLNALLRPYCSLPVIPLPFKEPFFDPYNFSTISCLVFSMNEKIGGFGGTSWNYGGCLDVFDNPAWQAVRLRNQELIFQNKFHNFDMR